MNQYRNGSNQSPDVYYKHQDIYTLHISLEIKGVIHKSAITIDTKALEELRPIDRCDDAMIAAIVGGTNEKKAMEIDKKRQQLAKEISGRVTDFLLSQIKAQDTINGYKQ
jgi:hypothetical protein